jgi:hypothetical protein
MRTLKLLATALVLAAPLAAQQPAAAKAHADHDPDNKVAGAGALPAGWQARTDNGGPITNVKFAAMGSGYHTTVGPAVILWRNEDKVQERFHTLATFTQTKPAQHAEGYGFLIGGKALDGEGQKYTYFLVRQDGKFLIKQRDGKTTKNITDGWVDNAAIVKPGTDGKSVNKLEVDGKASANKVTFSVNGKVVHTMEPGDIDSSGIVGFRVNHNLDLLIEGFDIHRL